MARKIMAWAVIVLSCFGLLVSAAGILAAWVLNKPAEREAIRRLEEIDSELALGQSALETAQQELERSLRVLDSTEAALSEFTQNDPQGFFEDVQTTLDDELVPELETAKERLINARDTLENVRVVVFGVNLVPFINVNIPDQTLTDLIASADALEAEIGDVSDLAEQASVLLESASQLFSGDFNETRASLEGFLDEVKTYREKVVGWREQVEEVMTSLPLWIDIASVALTLFLLWFGLSQVSLLLHGRAILRGETPWRGWRK